VYDAFVGEGRTFFHGHSFTGNQLGCAVALASLDLFEEDRLVERVAEKSRALAGLLAPIAELDHVGEVRQLGFMTGIELVRDRATKEPFNWKLAVGRHVCRRARDLGLVTRPLGDVVTFLPPLATPESDLEEMTAILRRAIDEATR
jgi:adenosylmethionine-8-amino-7-oxononanoate aminotransferase